MEDCVSAVQSALDLPNVPLYSKKTGNIIENPATAGHRSYFPW